jgi:tetratricopeptide (TPR) repeat protein
MAVLPWISLSVYCIPLFFQDPASAQTQADMTQRGVGARPPAQQYSEFRDEPKIAVVVGINNYQDESGFTKLSNATDDAVEFYEALKVEGYKGPGPDEDPNTKKKVYPILDDRAMRSVIENHLKKAIDRLQDKGTLIFFFAGHGMEGPDGKQYLAPYEVDRTRITELGVPLDEIQDMLAKSKVPRKIMFIDACRSKAAAPTGKRDEAEPEPAYFKHYREVKGLFTIYASEAGSPSFEDPNRKHGIFTFRLLQGLKDAKGPDGLLTFNELFRFVRDAVVKDTGVQVPTMSGEQNFDFPLAGKLDLSAGVSDDLSNEGLIRAGKIYYAEKYLGKARSLSSESEWQKALPLLNLAHRLQPDDVDILNARVDAHGELGEATELASDCDAVAKATPLDSDLRIRCGKYLQAARKWKAATDWLSEAVRLSPKYWEAYSLRAESYDSQGRPDLALTDYEKAIKADGPNYLKLYEADLQRELGRPDEALHTLDNYGQAASYRRALIEETVDNREQAEKDLRLASAIGLEDAAVYNEACLNRIRLGQVTSGILQCRLAAEKDKEDLAALARYGSALALAKRLDDAKALNKELESRFGTRLKPSVAELQNGAVLSNLLGDYAQAISRAQRTIDLDPEAISGYRHKAFALWKSGHAKEALDLLNQTIEQFPYYGLAYHTRADIRSETGDQDGAAKDRQRVAELKPAIYYY